MQSVNDTSDQHVQTSSESRCDVRLASLICTPPPPFIRLLSVIIHVAMITL